MTPDTTLLAKPNQGDLTRGVKEHYQKKQEDRNFELGKSTGIVNHHFGIGELPKPLDQISGPEVSKILNDLEVNQVRELMNTMGSIKSTDSLLDGGSGRGGTSFMLAEATDASLVGISISPYQVEFSNKLAQTRFSHLNTKFLEMDMLALNFPDRSFNHVFTNETTMYFEDLKPLFGGFARVLKPKGRYTLATWGVNDQLPRDEAWESRINDHYSSHMNTRTEYIDALRAAGFLVKVQRNLSVDALPTGF